MGKKMREWQLKNFKFDENYKQRSAMNPKDKKHEEKYTKI